MILLKDCRFVLVDSSTVKENVSVAIDDGKIVSVGVEADSAATDNIVDCSNRIVIPSFANLHSHAAMSLFRGYGEEMELMPWLETKMWPVEGKLTENDVYIGAMISCIEMLRSGVTAFNDMYFHADGIAKAAKQLGMRASVSWAVVDKEISSQKGDPVDNADAFINSWKGDELIIPSVGPHAIYTCNEETLKKAKEVADKHNTLLHIHVSETRNEVYSCWQKNGKRVVEYLNDLGYWSSKTVAAHCGWLTKNEISILDANDANVVHCPASNMKLATGGEFPFSELYGKANVCLGTDGAASNNSLNIFEEMKFASLLHKNARWDPTVATAAQVFDTATVNGFKALGIESGRIGEGMNADIVLLDASHVSMQPLTKERLLNHIVYSNPSAAVTDVMCAGKFILKDGKVQGVDEQAVRKKFAEVVGRLFG